MLSNEDQPWVTEKIKKIDRQRKRAYAKARRSEKWKRLNKIFKKEVKKAKQNFYKNFIEDLKIKKPSKWYSSLKRIASYDIHKREELIISEICHLSDTKQAEMIADNFAEIQNEYDPIDPKKINIPEFSVPEIPCFTINQVWLEIIKLNPKKSCVSGDVPPRVLKSIAAYIAEPFTHIINSAIKNGEYPNIFKHEIITPVPKSFPCSSINQLRNISGLLQLDKVMESLISKLIIQDMKMKRDISQYGNEKNTSIEHYLIKLIHRILESTDKNSQNEKVAVLATMIDWKSAFPRQDHTLGVQSFIKNGVRNSLIPILISYFQDRTMQVKFHNIFSEVRKLNGGGPQGAYFGILEYLSQSNGNANSVPAKNRFKFIDDLTILEILNLLSIGLSSINAKSHVPSNIGTNDLYIPPENLESQKYLNDINEWTKKQQMKINENKTKTMIFNFTRKFQFQTDLKLNEEIIETQNECKLLGTMISNNLTWDSNIKYLIKRANSRMQLLHKISKFGASIEDLKTIYTAYIRSILEQCSNVWHSSLTQENEQSLERIQKSALKIILKDKYSSYENACNILNIEDLKSRRNSLFEKFTMKNLIHPQFMEYFEENKQISYKLRKPMKYKITYSKSERLKNSAIIQMQHIANKLHQDGKIQ